jgi:hypothetical protein
MKLDDLIEGGPEIFETMSDAQLEEFFKPFLTLTRPDEKQLQKQMEKYVSKTPPMERKAVSSTALQNAKALGLDLGALLRNAKRKK